MKPANVTLVASLLLLVAACGPTGVVAIEFELTAVAVTEPPAELADVAFGALAVAEGDCAVDVVADAGRVIAAGLPALPTGFRYIVELSLMDTVRAGLPGPERPSGDDGHAEEESSHAEPTLAEVRMRDHDEGYEAEFDGGDIGGAPLGGLRGATIMIQSADEAIHVPVMKGTAGASELESEEGGHSHGV